MKKHLFFITIILSFLLTVSVAGAAGFTGDPDAVEKACKSVLMLEVMKDGDVIATGSGFVAFDNKTLVTNYHVIEDSDMIIALSDDGYEYIIMSVCIADEEKDLAILRFFSPTDLQPLPLHTAVDQKRIESVVAIGSPRGLINTVSTGNISAVFFEDGTQWIQLTAPISNGSSGGALFNDNGEVIGVTTLTRKDSQNINFAVHAKEIEALYKNWNGSITYLDEYTLSTPTPKPTKKATATPAPTKKPTATPAPTQNPSTQSKATVKKASVYSLTPTSVKLTWSSSNAVSCSIYYKKSSETSWHYVDTYTSKNANVYGLAPNTSYDFAFYAKDAKGASSAPYIISQKTSTATPTPAPPAIKQASIVASSTYAFITWSTSNAISCSIYYKKASETIWHYVDTYTTNSATIHGLEPNTSYNFILYARNAKGESSAPVNLSQKTSASTPTPTPRRTATPAPSTKAPYRPKITSVSFTNVTSTAMTVNWLPPATVHRMNCTTKVAHNLHG
ncbi:MAG: trypsin-like peptidase domain-containing protein [Clostridia bacterium]|nr:trypsin-like peptidase domain-containing protein [Clostridia bacterium]